MFVRSYKSILANDRLVTAIIMKLFVVLCCFVLAQAQIPKPCESPKQWEGNILRVDRGTAVKPANERLKVSYDETNQRVREITEYSFTPKPGQETYEVIYLHQTKKEYRINLVTRKCNVTTLTRPFMPDGVPSNATFEGFATVGAAGISGQSLNVQNWKLTSGTETFYGVVTSPDCVPVQHTHYMPPSTFVVSSFFDITAGIRDASVFTPPTECNQE
ncbi:mammalian ependymin-related protein 1-like [Mytilus trossulus]|uniref:mammalian ependymin-related protein 1-like n=1 Tax=Mytilus trossulus TaxID=6551 RepID=UPI003004A2D6